MPVRRLAAAVAAMALAGASCSGKGDGEGAAPATATTTTTTTTGPAPSSTATTTTTAAAPQAGDPACPPVPARAPLPPGRPRYSMRVDVRPADGAAGGDLTVRFTPDVATDRLVFRLWPNGPRPARAGARLDAGPVVVDGVQRAQEQPDVTTLVVPLGRTLAAGEAVTAELPWRLRLPGPIDDRVAAGPDWARLGSFFPILAWEPGVGWATDPPTSAFAEASMAPTADFDVVVAVPAGLDVLTSGQPDPAQPGRFRAEGVRDFALSIGRFRFARMTAAAPHPVEVVVGVEASLPASERAEAYASKVRRVLEDYANQFGPYPWPAYTLAITPDLGGGIEYPAHVMQGPRTGSRTTTHEVAHMWFYGLVGNNQGRDPWLDEGLASYAEARWEGTTGEFASRRMPAGAAGRAGRAAAPRPRWRRPWCRSARRATAVAPPASPARSRGCWGSSRPTAASPTRAGCPRRRCTGRW
jgi:hypothetical protein